MLKRVERLDADGGVTRYESAQQVHHHHIVCDDYGGVATCEDEALEHAVHELADGLSWDVEAHDVVLRGKVRVAPSDPCRAAARRPYYLFDEDRRAERHARMRLDEVRDAHAGAAVRRARAGRPALGRAVDPTEPLTPGHRASSGLFGAPPEIVRPCSEPAYGLFGTCQAGVTCLLWGVNWPEGASKLACPIPMP